MATDKKEYEDKMDAMQRGWIEQMECLRDDKVDLRFS